MLTTTGSHNFSSVGTFRRGWAVIRPMLVVAAVAAGGCARLVLPEFVARGEASWLQFGGTPQRTNLAPAGVAPPLELVWQKKGTASAGKTLLSAGQYVVCPTRDGHVVILDAVSGKNRARKKFRPGYEITCALCEDVLVVARRHGAPSLSVHNLRDGSVLWSATPGSIETEPLIADGRLIVAAEEKRLVAYELRTGTTLWTLQCEDRLRATPAYGDEKIVLGGDDGRVRAVDVRTGHVLWQYRTGAAVVAPAAVGHGMVFVGSTDRTFYALSLDSGLVRWVFPTAGAIREGACVTDSTVLFGSSDHFLYCVMLRSGVERWRFQAKSIISTPPVVAGSVVFVGSLDQHIYAIDVETGRELWKYDTGGRVRTSPLVTGKTLVVAAEGSRVLAFRKKISP